MLDSFGRSLMLVSCMGEDTIEVLVAGPACGVLKRDDCPSSEERLRFNDGGDIGLWRCGTWPIVSWLVSVTKLLWLMGVADISFSDSVSLAS